MLGSKVLAGNHNSQSASLLRSFPSVVGTLVLWCFAPQTQIKVQLVALAELAGVRDRVTHACRRQGTVGPTAASQHM